MKVRSAEELTVGAEHALGQATDFLGQHRSLAGHNQTVALTLEGFEGCCAGSGSAGDGGLCMHLQVKSQSIVFTLLCSML